VATNIVKYFRDKRYSLRPKAEMTAARGTWVGVAWIWPLLAALLVGLPTLAQSAHHPEATGIGTIPAAELPSEARQTLQLIRAGGPFPYAKDGAVFGNYEHLLPRKAPGYYREYTVRTPGARDRGTRRIISGRGGELYYTNDHYQSFKRVLE
jgi:ribonuclease T1